MPLSVLDWDGERPMTIGDLIAMARVRGLTIGPDLSRLPASMKLPFPNATRSESLSVREIIELASQETVRRRGERLAFDGHLLAGGGDQ
jgi:hypothetical protein